MAVSLDIIAAETLRATQAAIGASDEAMAGFAAVRDRLSRADALLDSAWSRVRERAEALLVQIEEETRELVATRGETVVSLDQLGGGLDELRTQAPQHFGESKREVEALGGRVELIPGEVTGLSSAAEEADRRLEAKLAAFQREVEEALSSAETLLRSELVGEVRRVETQIEQMTVNVQNYLEQQVIPTLMNRAQTFFDQLVQTEEDVRIGTEASASDTEATTDDSLRVLNDVYDDTWDDLQAIADALDELFHGLGRHLEDSTDKQDDQKHRWNDMVKVVERDLKGANDALQEVEQLLSRYSFVRM